MPDISSLTNEIDRLNTSISRWNAAIIVLMFLAALAAVGLVIAQRLVIKKSEQLASVADQKAQLESAVKDQKIAEAMQAAAKSNEAAGKANERAARLELEALSLQKDLIIQEPRTNLLYGENRKRLIKAFEPFAGQHYEVRVCSISFNQYNVDQDTTGVALLLISILKESQWTGSYSPVRQDGCSGQGMMVSVPSEASESTRRPHTN